MTNFWNREYNKKEKPRNKTSSNEGYPNEMYPIWENCLKSKNNKSLDVSCVVSAGDKETTELRIEKALKTYYDKGAKIFLLNGFNEKDAHDEGWEGESWRDDHRLVNIKNDLEKISGLEIVYAKNTVENMSQLRKFLHSKKYCTAETTTSETHLKRLKLISYHVFLDNEFENLAFSYCKELNEKTKKHTEIKEKVDYVITNLILSTIEKGDPNISEKYNQMRYGDFFGKLYNLKNKIQR